MSYIFKRVSGGFKLRLTIGQISFGLDYPSSARKG